MRVIIADDSELLRERIRALLASFVNVEVVGEAADGTTAASMVKELNPDLIILDVRMPGSNGFEALKEIRKNGTRPAICILTNYAYPQYKERCLIEGADYFFDKNTDFQKIASMITDLTPKQTGAEHA